MFCVFITITVEIDGVKFSAGKSGRVNFWTNLMSAKTSEDLYQYAILILKLLKLGKKYLCNYSLTRVNCPFLCCEGAFWVSGSDPTLTFVN